MKYYVFICYTDYLDYFIELEIISAKELYPMNARDADFVGTKSECEQFYYEFFECFYLSDFWP